jgi:4'-phosphopantetheinyl transferase
MDFPNPEFQPAWPSSPQASELSENEVHVWSARLVRPNLDYAACLEALAPEERKRAGQFRFERDRREYIVRHWLLRVILASYLRMEPAQLALGFEERGKPRLGAAPGAPPLHFNLSRSGNLSLVAVSRCSPVGVDVEKIRLVPEMGETAANFFSAAENARLAAAGPEQKLEVFFSVWTRKEAYLKATGEGIAGELGKLDCSESPAGWSLCSLSPAADFAGALAARAGTAPPLCRQWPE